MNVYDSYSDEIEFMGSGFRGRGGGRVQAARRTPFVAPADVIEVSSDDDEDEEPQAGPSVQRRPAETRNNPLFLSDSEDDDEEEARVAPPAPMAAGAPPPENAQESIDLNDYYVAKVLDIIPDVDPAYVTGLVQQSEGDIVGQVVNILLENPDYPKAQNKGKGKRKRDGEDQGEEGSSGASKAVKIDYASKDRQRLGGPLYYELAIEQLRADFPFIPMAHIRRTFTQQNVFYAPTYLALEAELRSGQLPYQRLTNGSASSRARVKGKQADRVDEELEKEKRWIIDKAEADRVARDKQLAEQLQDAEDCQIECGCCFSEYPLRKMIQCPDAHLFCRDCMTHYSETKLGEHDISIVCMDQSGCKLAFHEDELKKFLSEKLLELYYRVKQRKEIEAAGVENLEECPFCDYKVIIENPHEKLFRCARDDCGVVSCRACKKPDHLPKSCQEAESDKTLDARHAVEEAMTRALLRNCPSCSKAFMKEAGCNKMTCPNCKTLSCYICRKIIKGYDHFNQVRPQMPGNSPVTDPNKCPLWDHVNIEQRHADEVAAAAKKALEELKRANPGVDEKELQVELPKAAVAGPSNVAARPGVQVVVGGGGGAVVVGGGAHHVHVHHHAAPAPAAGAVHHGLNAQVEQQRLVALRQQFERERQLVRARNQQALARAHAHAQAHAQAAQAQRPVRGLPLRANAVRPPAAPAPVAQQHRAGHMPQITVRMNGQPVMPQELPGGAMLYVMDGRMQPVQVPPPVPAPAAAAVAVAAQRRRRR